jgi:predicted O-methyltransferase YrrM
MQKSPVAYIQNEWEIQKLLFLYNKMQPKKVMQIGCFAGGTLWYWLNFSKKLQEIAVIDLPPNPETLTEAKYKQAIEGRKEWINWIAKPIAFHFFQEEPTKITTINKAKKTFPENDIDFLFIDDSENAKENYENYSPLVQKGGAIVFDDIFGKVTQFWNELKEKVSNHAEIFEIRERGIGVVFI